MNSQFGGLLALVVLGVFTMTASAADVLLIPRSVLFGNPDRLSVKISPDGKQLAWIAPSNGVLNVWVASIDRESAVDLAQAKPVTRETKRGVREYHWSWHSDAILFFQDQGGNENWNIFRAPIAGGEIKNITPNPKARAEMLAISWRHPDEIVVALNDRDAELHDVHRIDLRSGQDTLVMKNPGAIEGNKVTDWAIDNDYRVRLVSTYADNGDTVLYKPRDNDAGFEKFLTIPFEDSLASDPQGFDDAGNILYLKDSRGRDTAALAAVDMTTGQKKILAADDKADARFVLRHPMTRQVQAVTCPYQRDEWHVIDQRVQKDIDYLKTVTRGDFIVPSRSQDDRRWIVEYDQDAGPIKFFLYDRATGKAQLLFTSNKKLDDQPLAKSHPLIIKSRDGLDLVSYLTLPLGTDSDDDGVPEKPLPMVLFVHGGPWGRDVWGYYSVAQWLANRGYAVLQVNFRGSTGFGKKFVNAGNLEWGGKMHDDLIDAVNFTIEKKIAQKDKIAIEGGSYGGYATLVGMTRTPEVFACGVDIVGISNLNTFLETVPPYWKPAMALFKTRVGDHETEDGRKFLASRSPITFVDRISKPLLIGHGRNDPRVNKAEADQIVAAMKSKNIPVTYIVFDDEGHGFARPQNRMSFNAVAEAFLAKHLGGRFEPIADGAFEGSTIRIEAGADQLPGLPDMRKN